MLMRRRSLFRLVVFAIAATPIAVTAAPAGDGAFLGPGGVLSDGTRAVLVEADTELSGYPTVVVGFRRGVTPGLDLGVELGGIDVAFLGRLHAKLRLWESEDHAWYTGLRLRLDFKRHRQDFPEGEFRPIDDLGFAVVPVLSLSRRFGDRAAHAIHVSIFYYLDLDIRPGFEPEHYVAPAMIGYEHRFGNGLFLQVDLGVAFELLQPVTEGVPIPKGRLVAGYGF